MTSRSNVYDAIRTKTVIVSVKTSNQEEGGEVSGAIDNSLNSQKETLLLFQISKVGQVYQDYKTCFK